MKENLAGESSIFLECTLPSSLHRNSPRSLVTSAAGETIVQEPWDVSPSWGKHRVSGNLVESEVCGWAGIGDSQEMN